MVPAANRHMQMQRRIRPNRDGSVEAEQLVTIGKHGLLVPLRSEESDLEILEHPDPP
jgi:hypothetical protein